MRSIDSVSLKFYAEVNGKMELLCPHCFHLGGYLSEWCVCAFKEIYMNKENDGTCTKCKERDLPGRCICSDPMWIVIPAGGHIHIQCPVHGDRKIYSSEPMLGCADKWVNDGPGPTQYWTETKTRDDIIWESYCD